MCDVLHMCTVVTEETILISFFWFADWVEAIHCDAPSVYIHAEVERHQYQRSGQSPWHYYRLHIAALLECISRANFKDECVIYLLSQPIN
jgi:hypothetical protein